MREERNGLTILLMTGKSPEWPSFETSQLAASRHSLEISTVDNSLQRVEDEFEQNLAPRFPPSCESTERRLRRPNHENLPSSSESLTELFRVEFTSTSTSEGKWKKKRGKEGDESGRVWNSSNSLFVCNVIHFV